MIRRATNADLPRLLEIYESARQFMRQNGNPTQWPDHYPDKALLLEDIRAGQLYVLEDGLIHGCFLLAPGPDPTYAVIDGAWGWQDGYGVLHRVAGTRKGTLAQCVAFGLKTFSHLRIDTHEKNIPMQKALARQGFTHRGTIICEDGTPRLAYDLHI